MSNRAAMVVFVVLAFAVSLPAQATLIGSTVTYTNSTASFLNGTFLIGDGIEDSYCYFTIGGVCQLGVEIDYAADTITSHLFNRYSDSYDAPANSVLYEFSSGVHISDANVLFNSFPGGDFGISFTDNTIGWVHSSWIWAAHSDYTIILGVKTVPEPGTLSLLGAGLLGLAAMRRGRTAA
jgi:hypothetical protein